MENNEGKLFLKGNNMDKFIIFTDVAFSIRNDNNAFGYDMYYNNFLFIGVAARGSRCFSSKEAKARAMLYHTKKVKEFHLS